MAFERVCRLDDLWQGEMENFEVSGTEVLLIHLDDGSIHAIQSICPHQEVELVNGSLEGKVLTCSMHLWQFDVSSGEGINPTHAEVAKYPVRVDGEDIFVDTKGIEPKFTLA